MQRLIFHVDVNSAFLSWEAARRVSQGQADLRLVPSAIGGDREKRTGVILAKSIPAKKFGVKTGEPVAMALRKCPDLILAKPDFRLYQQCSASFISICREYAPVVEQVSIDECFLDLTGTQKLYPDPIALAHTIKDRIRDTLGFTVNVGIGSCKLLAKMASDFEKPDKVHTLFVHEISQKMWPLGVGNLFTVGASTARKLENAGIHTIGDLANCDPGFLRRLTGDHLSRHLLDYANGIDHAPVLQEADEAKGYSISTTLEDNVTTPEQAHSILLALADSVSARMRADGAKAGCVAVTIRSADFKNRSHQCTLDQPTDLFKEIYQRCIQLFTELWNTRTPLRLIGISLTHISREEETQLSLFSDEGRQKARRLDQTYDAINAKFGSNTITRGTRIQSGLQVGKKFQAQIEQKNKK